MIVHQKFQGKSIYHICAEFQPELGRTHFKISGFFSGGTTKRKGLPPLSHYEIIEKKNLCYVQF